MKVLGIGESVIDEISVVGKHSEVVATDRDAGGPVLVALIALAKLGADCTFVTTLGQDKGGTYIRGLLKKAKVSLDARSHAASKINIIVVDEETGAREKMHSDIEYPPIADLEPAFLRSFDLVVMDRHERQAFYEVREHLQGRANLMIDPSTELSDFTIDMMKSAECPIVPLETLAQIEGPATVEEAAEALFRMCGRSLVVTLGEFGSLVHDGTNQVIVPALDVNVVNALGAGDVYRGAFAYGMLQGWALEECARYGNVAAALQCRVLGNAGVVPSKAKIERMMKQAVYRSHNPEGLAAHFDQMRRELQPLVPVK